MKNVLYVGPYRQEDEWGVTSRAFANLLTKQDINLAIRPIWFNGTNQNPKLENLEVYETKKLPESDLDILIQFGLPSYLNYDGRFKKNIAVTIIDSTIENTDWLFHLNLFDLVVVFSQNEKKLLEQSGVTSQIYAFDAPPHYQSYPTQDIGLNIKHNRIFLTMGSLMPNSGFRECVASYLKTFSIMDDVVLIVLHDPPELEKFSKEIENIKSQLNLYKNNIFYPNIMLINSTEKPVINYLLDKYAQFFIDVSYEARPSQILLTAIAYGVIPITIDTINLYENKFKVESNESIALMAESPIPYLYTGSYGWKVPRMKSLANIFTSTLSQENIDIEKERLVSFRNSMPSREEKNIKEILCTQ